MWCGRIRKKVLGNDTNKTINITSKGLNETNGQIQVNNGTLYLPK
jgi:hypothetical protein